MLQADDATTHNMTIRKFSIRKEIGRNFFSSDSLLLPSVHSIHTNTSNLAGANRCSMPHPSILTLSLITPPKPETGLEPIVHQIGQRLQVSPSSRLRSSDRSESHGRGEQCQHRHYNSNKEKACGGHDERKRTGPGVFIGWNNSAGEPQIDRSSNVVEPRGKSTTKFSRKPLQLSKGLPQLDLQRSRDLSSARQTRRGSC